MKTRYKVKELRRLMKKPGLLHPTFGNLLKHNAVRLAGQRATGVDYKEKNPFYIHLSVTSQCNARCKGCINSLVTTGGAKAKLEDTEPLRDAAAIKKIITRGCDKDAVICLYGGEPLLQPAKIQTLIDALDTKYRLRCLRYMLYTNAGLLGQIIKHYPRLIKRLWLVSVSIDGSYNQHKIVRRGSNLLKIENNLMLLKRNCRASVLMWSTLRENQSLWNCFEEFLKLYKKGSVDLFFWHWIETPEPFSRFTSYAEKYEAQLRKIMDVYVFYLKRGLILPITHVNELLLYIFTARKRATTACAVELEGNYDIVAGKIYACADLPRELAIGRIAENGDTIFFPPGLSKLTMYKKHLGCSYCGVSFYCGGRCPVEAFISSGKRLLEYCQLMRLHVGIVKEYAPLVGELFRKKRIDLQAVYDKIVFFNQFTDVTP